MLPVMANDIWTKLCTQPEPQNRETFRLCADTAADVDEIRRAVPLSSLTAGRVLSVVLEYAAEYLAGQPEWQELGPELGAKIDELTRRSGKVPQTFYVSNATRQHLNTLRARLAPYVADRLTTAGVVRAILWAVIREIRHDYASN